MVGFGIGYGPLFFEQILIHPKIQAARQAKEQQQQPQPAR